MADIPGYQGNDLFKELERLGGRRSIEHTRLPWERESEPRPGKTEYVWDPKFEKLVVKDSRVAENTGAVMKYRIR